MISNVIIGGLFLYYSIEDIRKQMIDIRILLVSFPIILAGVIFREGKAWLCYERGFLFILGIMVLIISILSKEAIGKGDAYVIIWAALLCDVWVFIKMLLVAYFLLFATSFLCIIIRKKKPIPFIPYMGIGFLLSCIL